MLLTFMPLLLSATSSTGNSIQCYNNINNYQTSYSSSYIDNSNTINFSQELQKNIELINSYKNLDDNWNGYGALKFSESVIDNALYVLYFLSRQPDVFPTGRNSIQFEYEKDNGDYLEFEIYEDHITAFKIIASEETECQVSAKETRKMVVDFYA